LNVHVMTTCQSSGSNQNFSKHYPPEDVESFSSSSFQQA
jgi:hypothetical protein